MDDPRQNLVQLRERKYVFHMCVHIANTKKKTRKYIKTKTIRVQIPYEYTIKSQRANIYVTKFDTYTSIILFC